MFDAAPPFASFKASQSTENIYHLKAPLLKAVMGLVWATVYRDLWCLLH